MATIRVAIASITIVNVFSKRIRIVVVAVNVPWNNFMKRLRPWTLFSTLFDPPMTPQFKS